MALCTKCGVSHSLPELTNYSVPVPLDANGKPAKDDATERLCFRCVRSELNRLKLENSTMRSALQEVMAHAGADMDGSHVCWLGETTFLLCKKALETN